MNVTCIKKVCVVSVIALFASLGFGCGPDTSTSDNDPSVNDNNSPNDNDNDDDNDNDNDNSETPDWEVEQADGQTTRYGGDDSVIVSEADDAYLVSGDPKDACVEIEETCFDFEAIKSDHCDSVDAQVDVVADEQPEVLDVVCYPPENGDHDVVEVDAGTDIPDVDEGDVITFAEDTDGEPISQDVDLTAGASTLFGNGTGETVIDGAITISAAHTRLRASTTEGSVAFEEEADGSQMTFCRVEGDLIIDADDVTVADCQVWGDVFVLGDDATLINIAVQGQWHIDGSATCGGNYRFEDENDDGEIQDDEIGEQLTCTGDSSDCPTGDFEGEACLPSGADWPLADVALEGTDCNDDPFERTVTADADGLYQFQDVPSGSHELTIESGSYGLTVEEASVDPNQTTELTGSAAECLESEAVSIAVLEGSWDDLGGILDAMGFSYDPYDSGFGVDDGIEAFLSDSDAMAQYDIIAAESGTARFSSFEDPDDDVTANLETFVEQGGSLYVSELATDYVEKPFPGTFEFSDSSSGDGDQDITAQVVHAEVMELLGSDTAELYFGPAGWEFAEEVGPEVNAFIVGDIDVNDGETIENVPLMGIYRDSDVAGRALYTSVYHGSGITDDSKALLEYAVLQL